MRTTLSSIMLASVLTLIGAGCAPATPSAPMAETSPSTAPPVSSGSAGESPSSATPDPETKPSPSPETTTAGAYTLAEVAAHDEAASCWSAINGSVYDLTAWIDRHPGGSDAIKYLCGKDGTSAFLGQHQGDARPESRLASFRIGELK